MSDFRSQIQQGVERASLSQKVAARYLGIRYSTLNHWMTGRSVPSEYVQRSVLEKLAEYTPNRARLAEALARYPAPKIEETWFLALAKRYAEERPCRAMIEASVRGLWPEHAAEILHWIKHHVLVEKKRHAAPARAA